MARIDVIIHGKTYKVACDDGQEDHLRILAKYIDERATRLADASGTFSETHLMVLTSLLVADEMADIYNELDDLRRTVADGGEGAGRPNGGNPMANGDDAAAGALDQASARLEELAARLETLRV